MTDRRRLDDMTDDQLDALYDERDRARRVAVALECELARAEDRAVRAEAALSAARNLATEQADSIRQQLDHTSELEAAIARVRRLCELTIATSARAQAVQQAHDTLAALEAATAIGRKIQPAEQPKEH